MLDSYAYETNLRVVLVFSLLRVDSYYRTR